LQIRIKKPPGIGRKIFTRFTNCRLGREILLKETHAIHGYDPIKVHSRRVVFNPLMYIGTDDEIANGEIEIIHDHNDPRPDMFPRLADLFPDPGTIRGQDRQDQDG
jgi:hypothetical protein